MARTTGPDQASPRAKKGERGRGPRSAPSRTVTISKALSRLLRHQAVNEGVPITNDGWVRLDHLLAWKGLHSRNGVNPPPTIDEIWDVVEDNEKKRFAVRWVGKVTFDETGEDAQGTKKNLLLSSKDAKTASDKAKAMGLEKVKVDDPTEDAGAGVEGATVETQEQPSTTLGQLVDGKTPQHDESIQAETTDATSDPQASTTVTPETLSETETARTIAHYRNTQPHPPPTEFQIRATQGHSIQTVASDTSLLMPITLDDPATIPHTCVHGTFYGAWSLILRSGGLKRMGRNHVHFASGPALSEVGVTEEGKQSAANVSKSDKVISGMRNDAQLLIYVDLERCLEEVREQDIEMSWWKSENGVILTEGVDASAVMASTQDVTVADEASAMSEAASKAVDTDPDTRQGPNRASPTTPTGETAEQAAASEVERQQKVRNKRPKGKSAQAQAQSDKLVPMKYWSVVVDVKGEHGVIWRQGEGVVKELPESLASRGTPKSRGRGRGRGR